MNEMRSERNWIACKKYQIGKCSNSWIKEVLIDRPDESGKGTLNSVFDTKDILKANDICAKCENFEEKK